MDLAELLIKIKIDFMMHISKMDKLMEHIEQSKIMENILLEIKQMDLMKENKFIFMTMEINNKKWNSKIIKRKEN